jgi:hypothetical protein
LLLSTRAFALKIRRWASRLKIGDMNRLLGAGH